MFLTLKVNVWLLRLYKGYMIVYFGYLFRQTLSVGKICCTDKYECWSHNTPVKSISTGAQYVTPDSKFKAKKSKCASLDQENDFSAPNSSSLPWLVNGPTQLCTSKKECNKLGLTAPQYF
jgi:hypothetical protein